MNKRMFSVMLCLACLFMILSSAGLQAEEVQLTEEEQQYIKEHPIVTVGVDPLFAPYEFIDVDGHYKGISADFLKLIEIKTGIVFQVAEGLEWHEAHDKAIAGEIDVLACVGKTDEREAAFLFTEAYQNFQRVLLSRSDDQTYTFGQLETVDLGVQRNSSHFGFVTQTLGLSPELYTNNDEVLLALSYGEIDAAVTNYAASRYRIKELGLANIKIDEIDDVKNSSLHIAVNHDKPVLMGIINKGLEAITKEERTEIANKWLGIEQAPDYSEVIRVAVFTGIIVGLLIVIFILWNRTLQKEIKRREKVEEALKVAIKAADEANGAKSIFLARMSHEIRTPLNAINGIGYLLENTKTTSMQKQYIKNLKSASYNLLGIVNDILDFSKIEAGEVQIEEVVFNLDELLNKVSTILMPKAIEKGIGFHVIKDIHLNGSYLGDPTRTEQVLINLAGNAIKFTDEGEVSIEVKRAGEHEDVHDVLFEVNDTGIGISNEQMSDLFTPFHQLDSSITRKYGGTGLGLNISRKFVELMGGSIGADSVYGQGSKFHFTLSLKLSNEVDHHDLTQLYPDLRDIEVLLYEEDDITEKLVLSYLKSFHLKVHSASSPDDVVRQLRGERSRYRLLIMNINMKTSDALEIIQLLNQPSLKIILLAKNIREAQYEMAEGLGVKHIIMKPVISSILYNSIVQCFHEEVVEKTSLPDAGNVDNNGVRILLVEDNEVNQLIEKEILTRQGYTVDIAENGKVAVEMCRINDDYQIVLMDIHMPVMDGYEATEKIRAFNQEVPILAMTAVSFTNVKDRCDAVGMNGYITKPFEPVEMFSTIRGFIKEKPVSRPCDDTVDGLNDDCHFLDVRQGLMRVGHNEKLYYEVLEKFLLDLSDAKDVIHAIEKTSDYKLLGEMVHKFKGTSGNVGALELFQAAKILMDAIRSDVEVDIQPYFLEFANVVDVTERVVKAFVERNSKMQDVTSLEPYDGDVQANEKDSRNDTANIKIDRDTHQQLIKLRNLLDQSDLDAFRVSEHLHEALKEETGWQTLQSHMKVYDFKKAAESLNGWLLSQED